MKQGLTIVLNLTFELIPGLYIMAHAQKYTQIHDINVTAHLDQVILAITACYAR